MLSRTDHVNTEKKYKTFPRVFLNWGPGDSHHSTRLRPREDSQTRESQVKPGSQTPRSGIAGCLRARFREKTATYSERPESHSCSSSHWHRAPSASPPGFPTPAPKSRLHHFQVTRTPGITNVTQWGPPIKDTKEKPATEKSSLTAPKNQAYLGGFALAAGGQPQDPEVPVPQQVLHVLQPPLQQPVLLEQGP